MSQVRSKTVLVILWSAPLVLIGVMMAANALLAAADARLLRLAGLTPAGGLAGLPFWGVFFGILALLNLPALAVFSRWMAAVQHERAARAEVLAAMRWPARLDRWQPQLWPDTAPPAAHPTPRPAPVLLARMMGWHLRYAAPFMGALVAPVAVLGLLALL